MQKPPHEFEGFVIIALGAFNPAIFQPFWFSSNNLIRKEEAEVANANVEIIHRNAAIFSGEWFSLQVTGNRFLVESNDPTKFSPLRDLVLGTFRVLEHTPISAFGLNRHQHFRMPSADAWHAFGHHFAPKESWDAILTKPGMRSLTIEGTREKQPSARIQIKIEPSAKLDPGVCIHVNQHHQLDKNGETSSRDRGQMFLTILQESCEDFLSYTDSVSTQLFSSYDKKAE